MNKNSFMCYQVVFPTFFSDWIDSKMQYGHTDYAQRGSLLGSLLVLKDKSTFAHPLCYSRLLEAPQTNKVSYLICCLIVSGPWEDQIWMWIWTQSVGDSEQLIFLIKVLFRSQIILLLILCSCNSRLRENYFIWFALLAICHIEKKVHVNPTN